MKCTCTNGCILMGGDSYVIEVAGKRIHFEMNRFSGPGVLNAAGDVADKQPGPHSPFWSAVTYWHQQGRQVGADGICIWVAPPKDELVHLGGRNYALKGSALAEKFLSNTDAGQLPAGTT